MEVKFHFSFSNLSSGNFKRIEVGDEVYLVSPGGISKRKEILFEKYFDKSSNGSNYLDFHGYTFFRDKLLKVKASIFLAHGPLGLRTNFNAEYDGKKIGDYSALASYAGGGARGEWPELSGDDWMVLFEIPRSGGSERINNRLLVEHYIGNVEKNQGFKFQRLNSITLKNFPKSILEKEFSAGQIEGQREEKWSVPVCERNHVLKGTLSLCYYPGYARYYISPLLHGEKQIKKADHTFIGEALNKNDGLYSIEYESREGRQILFPWDTIQVDVDYSIGPVKNPISR